MSRVGTNSARAQTRQFIAEWVLLATALNALIIETLNAVGIFRIPLHHQLLVLAQGTLCFVFFLTIRRRPSYLNITVWFYALSTIVVGFSTDLLNVADSMRFTWHFAANSAALLIGGLPAGIIVTLASLASIMWANSVYGLLPLVSLVTLCNALVLTFVVMAFVVQYMDRMLNDLQASRDSLARLARTDALTGLPNRLAFDRYLTEKLGQSEKFSLIIMDLDRFKRINDTYGHASGDTALIEVASILSRAVGEGDMAARFGGEEFCLLFVDIDADTALTCIETIRQRIEQKPIKVRGGIVNVTASFGLVHSAEPHRSGSALLSAADRALYEAKKNGRNRCALAA